MIAWELVVALCFISAALGYLYGRRREWNESFDRRMRTVEQDRKDREAHQLRTLEKNTLGRFRNAVEAAYSGRFMTTSRVPGPRASGGHHFHFKAANSAFSGWGVVVVNLSNQGKEITLFQGGIERVFYPIADVETAIERFVRLLGS